MKRILLLIPCGLLLFSVSISGQVNKDSLSLASEIYQDQLKLGKLLSQLEQQTNKKEDAFDKAKNSANINSTAADNLSNNPSSKKLARKAKNRAIYARKESRNARIESDNLDKLHKNIQSLKKRIESNQAELNKQINHRRIDSTVIDRTSN